MATATATAPASGSTTAATQATTRPFITGSREIESHTYDQTVTMTASTQTLPSYDFTTDGYLAGLYVIVTGTAATNAATVAFTEDAPWNAIQTFTFSDVSNRPIIGPMSGWELKTAIKFGGYSYNGDPQNSASYLATSGSGASGGSFSFVLHMPVEFVHRNALGSLTNLSNAAVFRLDMTLNSTTNVYSTAPTNAPSVRVQLEQYGWMESSGSDPFGNPASPAPPAVDSVQYWERQTYTVNSGAQNFRLTPFEGNVRNLIFVLRDSDGARTGGETNWPDPLRFRYDATTPYDRLKRMWEQEVEELLGYTAPVPTTAAGSSTALTSGQSFRDAGTFPLMFTRDYGLKPGAESCYGYMYVSSGTALRFDGTIGGSGSNTLTVLVNYINPAGGNALALTGGK